MVGVGLVVFRADQVLLIKRGKPPFLGQWSIPGGRVEYGESLRAAALRELAEETGVSARITGLIDVFEALPDGPAQDQRHMVMIDYAAEWTDGEARAGDDACAAAFVSIDDARSRLAWDETRRALDMALAMRAAP